MTTRLRPRTVEGRTGLLNGCLEKELLALEKDDAVAFFQNQGIQGTRAEIEATCAPYGYHPLTLSILAGYILGNRSKPNDVSVARELNVTNDIIQNKHHVLEVAYNSLSPEEAKLLSTIACFRSPTGYEALQSITDSPLPEGEGQGEGESLDDQLEQLEARGLLHWDKKENKYDLHPIVRRYAYERLTAPDRTATHTRLKDYFEVIPTPQKIESLNDLAPVIELYHHMVRAGQLDEACELLYQRLNTPTYYQFGAYQLRIELLRILFPDGENKPPKLENENAQAWTLNELANSYSLNGEPHRAVQVWTTALPTAKKLGRKKNLAIGLGNLAYMAQIHIGALSDAEHNLRRSIIISREIEDVFWEAVGYAERGKLLAYRGLWDKAEIEISKSIKMFLEDEQFQYATVATYYQTLRKLQMIRSGTQPNLIYKQAKQNAQQIFHLLEQRLQKYGKKYVRDYIVAYWASGASFRANGDLEKAEKHLNESLRRCRAINLVESEADILLEISKLRHAQDSPKEALRLAHEALIITERSGYVLQGGGCEFVARGTRVARFES